MALNLTQKKAIVDDLTHVASGAISAAVAEYRGLSVTEMTELRAKARQNGVIVQVVRNTLSRLAVKGTDFENLTDSLTGPVVLMFANDEPGAPAKLLRDFAKGHENLQVRALALGKDVFGADQLNAIASLPSKDEAIGQLAAVLQAPISKLVRTMAETYSPLARVLDQVRAQKEAA